MKTLMRMLLEFSAQHITAPIAPPSMRRLLEAVRFAGFRRLHPIIPDRAAFCAAIEGETHGDHAENQCQSLEHDPPLPTPTSYGLKSGIFKPPGPAVHSSRMHLKKRHISGQEPRSMQQEPQAAEFDI